MLPENESKRIIAWAERFLVEERRKSQKSLRSSDGTLKDEFGTAVITTSPIERDTTTTHQPKEMQTARRSGVLHSLDKTLRLVTVSSLMLFGPVIGVFTLPSEVNVSKAVMRKPFEIGGT